MYKYNEKRGVSPIVSNVKKWYRTAEIEKSYASEHAVFFSKNVFPFPLRTAKFICDYFFIVNARQTGSFSLMMQQYGCTKSSSVL